jgi:hypothetical protein
MGGGVLAGIFFCRGSAGESRSCGEKLPANRQKDGVAGKSDMRLLALGAQLVVFEAGECGGVRVCKTCRRNAIHPLPIGGVEWEQHRHTAWS